MDFLRGYMVHYSAGRGRAGADGIGAAFKEAITEAGDWSIFMMMQGETIPKESNHVRLSKDKQDAWGIPLLVTSVGYDDNDDKVVKDFLEQGSLMLEKAGCTHINKQDTGQAPGLDIHEMGGIRMGKDPATSLLNEHNQLHHCKNVFVTDGACMVSTGTQNPSLTYMAITARAANFAVAEMKKGNL
jgi:choline dehydrogenase-like flavoprotein